MRTRPLLVLARTPALLLPLFGNEETVFPGRPGVHCDRKTGLALTIAIIQSRPCHCRHLLPRLVYGRGLSQLFPGRLGRNNNNKQTNKKGHSM